MIHDLQRNVLFIASGDGTVFIMNSLQTEPETICKIKTDQAVCIRGLTRSFNLNNFWQSRVPMRPGGQSQNYLLASDINGYITIFDINQPGKEKLAKRIGNTQGRPK